MVKKISIRIVGLIAIVITLNFVYNLTLFRPQLFEMCEQVVQMKDRQKGTDIFYFAESSNFNILLTDKYRQTISEMTNFFFPKLTITSVDKPAAHAGVFKQWLNHLDLTKHKPKAIVMTMNLRSFDAGWINSNLESAMQESIALLRPYPNLLNRFLLSLNAFDDKTTKQREKIMLDDWKYTQLQFPYPVKYKTVREWDDAIAAGQCLAPGAVWEEKNIQLSCHYVKGYAFNLNENNPRIKDFDFIADWCHKNNINLYMNLLAENMHFADSLVGKELVFLMRNNRDYLVKRYTKNNCVVVDNLEAVNWKDFSELEWTTEHYNYKGRMIIAKNLAEKLKIQFNNYYKKAY